MIWPFLDYMGIFVPHLALEMRHFSCVQVKLNLPSQSRPHLICVNSRLHFIYDEKVSCYVHFRRHCNYE